MSIIRRIIGGNETRAVGGNWFADNNVQSSAGVQINQQNATSIGAVWSSIQLYSSTIAAMPWGVYIRDRGVRRPVTRPLWLDNPVPNNPNYTGFDFKHKITSSLLTDGNAFVFFLTNDMGDVVEARVLDPQKVKITADPDGTPHYHVTTNDGTIVVGAEQMVHIPLFAPGETLRSLSPIDHHRTTMGLAQATQEYSALWYQNGAVPSGVIKINGELTSDQAEMLRQDFSRRHSGLKNMHRVSVLTGGADYVQASVKLSDMQLIETMHWGVEAIARIYGVPLQLLQYPGGNTSYASSETLGQAWLTLGLAPMVARIEAGLQRMIVGQTTFIKFNFDSLLRPTTAERMAVYVQAVNNGIYSLNEVRALEDKAPIGPEGDVFRQPLNIGKVGQCALRSSTLTER